MDKERRLSDKIIAAHAKACQDGCMDVANLLLQALELAVSSIGGENTENRENTEILEAAFERHQQASHQA